MPRTSAPLDAASTWTHKQEGRLGWYRFAHKVQMLHDLDRYARVVGYLKIRLSLAV